MEWVTLDQRAYGFGSSGLEVRLVSAGHDQHAGRHSEPDPDRAKG
jgi:hypothetical protein